VRGRISDHRDAATTAAAAVAAAAAAVDGGGGPAPRPSRSTLERTRALLAADSVLGNSPRSRRLRKTPCGATETSRRRPGKTRW